MYAVQVTARLIAKGHRVCFICRDDHLESHPFLDAGYVYQGDSLKRLFRRKARASCTAYSLQEKTLGVAYPRVEAPYGRLFIDMSDSEIEEYVDYHVERTIAIVRRQRLSLLQVNHVVLMPYVAFRVKERTGIPYVLTVHGSTIEYVLNRDSRYLPYAVDGLRHADRVVVLNSDVRDRTLAICPEIENRLVDIPVGVDTKLFNPAGINVATSKKAILQI